MPKKAFFPNFAALCSHLDTLGFFRIRPDMGRIQSVLAVLGLTRPPYPVVQIVGTNGKGSTASFLAALAVEHGLKTGLFTSPHFISFAERCRINGMQLSPELFLASANTVMEAGGEGLTYFELQTAMAAVAFAEEKPELAIFEAGLGGRWDATTAIASDLTLVTPIGRDHCNILGDTLESIADNKAGAFRYGVPIISARQNHAAQRVLEGAAVALAASFVISPGAESCALPPSALPPRLTGSYQTGNSSLALAGWRHMAARYNWRTEAQTEADAIAKAFIPGRLQFIAESPAHGHPFLLLDGAHNTHGLNALGQTLAERSIAPAATIFACLADKNPADMAALIRVLSCGPIFVPPIQHCPRSLPPVEIAACIGLNATPVASLPEALSRAGELARRRLPAKTPMQQGTHPVLLCGSLYLLADFFTLRPECLV